MQITTYTDPSCFETLQTEWEDLLSRAVTAPIFSTPQYQRVWWQHLGEGELRVIALRRDDNRLVGLAPLYLQEHEADGRRLVFVGCVDVSDYLDVIVDRAAVTEVYQTLIDYLAAQDEAAWSSGYFCSLPMESPSRDCLPGMGQARGWEVRETQEDICPVITLAATWEDYLAGIKKKQRHEIRRKLRKAESEANTRWYVIERGGADLDGAVDTFIDLHQKSSVDKEEFWDDKLKGFFRSVVHVAAEAGWLKLFFVEIDGEPASTLLCFDYRDEFLVYNSGFDPTRFGHLSPGNIIVSYSIQHAIELGRRRYDFLRGDEVYKLRFGGEPEPVYGLHIRR
ncbi:MAG: GNAT family N-acetyltransferase [Anaerolineae bacterium]